MAFLNLPLSVFSDAALLALQPLQLLLLLSRLGTARIASLLSVTRGARGRGDVAAEQAQEREAMAEVRQAVRDAATAIGPLSDTIPKAYLSAIWCVWHLLSCNHAQRVCIYSLQWLGCKLRPRPSHLSLRPSQTLSAVLCRDR